MVRIKRGGLSAVLQPCESGVVLEEIRFNPSDSIFVQISEENDENIPCNLYSSLISYSHSS